MATITIDGREVQCRDGTTVLRAALEAGWDVPHYCYHPGMSVVASCRLCLMEMMMPNPQTGEMGWAPKLFPSCQTPVRNGMVVRFDSPKVHAAREQAIDKHRQALNSAKTNKEYSGILTALNTEKADNAKIETEMLQLMEEIQGFKDEAVRLEAERQKLLEEAERSEDLLGIFDAQNHQRRGTTAWKIKGPCFS